MTLFYPNSICCGSIELCYPYSRDQQHHLYPPWYFWSCPWWEGRYSKPREKNWDSNSHHHLKEVQSNVDSSSWMTSFEDEYRQKEDWSDVCYPGYNISHQINSVRHPYRRPHRYPCYLFNMSILWYFNDPERGGMRSFRKLYAIKSRTISLPVLQGERITTSSFDPALLVPASN